MRRTRGLRPLVSVIIAMVLAGCTTVPFEGHKRVPVSHMDPKEVSGAYSAQLPESINLLSSLVFRYTFIGKVSALGTVEADIRGRRFSVVGISPLGVKLFSVEADQDGIRDRFVLPPLAEKGDLASAVAGDIWRIYFDLVPSPGARVRKKKSSIEFIERVGDGFLVHVFAGPEGNLVMKKFYMHGVLRWKVGYYEYIREGGRLYPGGIVLTDYMSGYELTARTKKIYDTED
jgi:hypothetical protein